jgi:hypothetical protein
MRPSPSPPVSGPDPYLRQHGRILDPAVDNRHFRTYFRRVSQLETLFRDRLISFSAYQAALILQRDAETVTCAGFALSGWIEIGAGEHCRVPRLEMSERTTAALARLAQAREMLGALYPFIEGVAMLDLSWADLGRRYCASAKTVKSWAISALRALA